MAASKYNVASHQEAKEIQLELAHQLGMYIHTYIYISLSKQKFFILIRVLFINYY